MSLFAISFVGKSFLIGNSSFQQTDPTHWVLDVSGLVTPSYQVLKEVFVCLTDVSALPPDMALSIYVSVGRHEDWIFRGFVSNEHPSDTMPLSWPEVDPTQAGGAVLGVSLEPLVEAGSKEGAKIGAKSEFCKRVGLDLFQYMQSFGNVSTVGPDQLLVPANVLDRWFTRISNRLKNDPDFLTRQKDII